MTTRIGDVLRVTDARTGGEVEVTVFEVHERTGMAMAHVPETAQDPNRVMWMMHASSTKALRRPVQIGDVLRSARYDPLFLVERRTECGEAIGAGWYGVSVVESRRVPGHLSEASIASYEWTHADGTPLDLPAAAEAKGDVALNGDETGTWKPSAPIVIGPRSPGRLAGKIRAEAPPPPKTEPAYTFVRTPGAPQASGPLKMTPSIPMRGSLRLGDSDGPHVVLQSDGTISHHGYDADEAAAAFWAAVERHRPREPLSVDALGRALFETDADVIAYVIKRSEFAASEGRGNAIARSGETMQRCWDRGFAGELPETKWWVRATDRAKAVHARLAR